MPPTILLNITHGFQARMLLRSKIAETLLAQGAKLVICSPNAHEEYFRREFDHPQISLEKTPAKFSRVEAYAISLRQYILMNPRLGGTLNHKRESLKKMHPWRHRITRAMNLVLGNIPPLRWGYMQLESWMWKGKEWDAILAKHKPNLVVTGTPGFNQFDVHLLRAARRRKITTSTVMLSWDNLTSKGYMNGVPDHLLVWSDLMADEAVKYHDYPRDRIHWVGAAQFDHYHGFRERFDRAAWRAAHGIPADALLLVYGTINPALVPHEIEIVKQIVAAMRTGKFSKPAYLWVRLHPQAVRGIYKTNVEDYRQLAGDDVRIEEPEVRSEALAWDLPAKDAEHLASLLAAADVAITPNSTLSIDAACVDTPIINVYFDGPLAVSPQVSVRRFLHYTHYSELLKTSGVTLSYSIEEFAEHANSYVKNQSLHADGREEIIQQQFNRLDGQSGVRTAYTLLSLAGVRQSARETAGIVV